jgi:hypothetical protein
MFERKMDKKLIIIMILLVIIAFLIYKLRIGEIEYQNLVPTGNVDVFDIGFNCCCNDKDKDDVVVPGLPGNDTSKKDDTKKDNKHDNKQDNNESNKDSSNNSNNEENNEGNTVTPGGDIPIFDEETDAHEIDKIFVDDKNGDYIYQQKLEIFNNPAFEYTNKIAPGVSNSYQFVVHNSSDQNLMYYVEMYEITEYKVNMKYRLKRNGNYVLGDNNHWVSASELKTELTRINKESSDRYTLDWKWFDDDKNDTKAGKYMTENYNLNIRFHFETIGD